MFYEKNKKLIHGAIAVVVVWLIAYYVGIGFTPTATHWEEAEANVAAAEATRVRWEAENFKRDTNFMPKPDAVSNLDRSSKGLGEKLTTLKSIEFGTKESLQKYLIAAAEATGEDHNNYLEKLKKKTEDRARQLSIQVFTDLGIYKANENMDAIPVPLNLIRLAMVDQFLTACQTTGVGDMDPIRHYEPVPIEAPAESRETLIQFPMKVVIHTNEKAFAKLLFELQKETDAGKNQRYFCIRGYHIRPAPKTDGVEACIQVSALLPEKFVKANSIPFKALKKLPGGTPLNSGGRQNLREREDY